jgi:hypothetical protein
LLKNKIFSLLIVSILCISLFLIIIPQQKVKATDGEIITNLSFKGWESNQGNYAYINNTVAYATDYAVLIYDSNANLKYIFYPTNSSTSYTYTIRTSIINFNDTSIIIASTYSNAGTVIRLNVWFYNLISGISQQIITAQSIDAGVNGVPNNSVLKIINLENVYYIINSLKFPINYDSLVCASIYPTFSAKVTPYSSTTNDFYIVGSGVYFESEIANTIYYLSKCNTTGLELWQLNLATGTYTYKYSWSTLGIENISSYNYQMYLINTNYNSVLTGNYSINIAWTMYNSTFSAIAFATVRFDGISYYSIVSTSIQCTSMNAPLRIIGVSVGTTSFVNTYKLYCVDKNYDFRFIGVTFDGSAISEQDGYANYGISPLQDINSRELFTYVYANKFDMVTANIGGFTDLSQVSTNQIMFLIDYSNNRAYATHELLTVSGTEMFTQLSCSSESIFPFTLQVLNAEGTGYVTYVSYSRTGLFELPPLSQPKYTFNASIVSLGAYQNYSGAFNVYVSGVSLTPYTKADIPTITAQSATYSGLIINGQYEFIHFTGTPNNEPDYYYQLIVFSSQYLISESPDVYQAIETYCFFVAHKNGVTPIPDGLPDDYDVLPEPDDELPTPTDTNIGVNVIIPVEVWLVILIYMIFSILLGLMAGKEGLVVGLIIATIICLIAQLIPLWVIIPVILALIVLILKETGVLNSSEGI